MCAHALGADVAVCVLCVVCLSQTCRWVATKWLHDKPITEWDAEGEQQHHL